MDNILSLAVIILMMTTQCPEVSSHGRLMNPPARNTEWRFGFPCPVNYNDNELFCGGFVIYQIENNGQCGTCGDPKNLAVPRPHETGGKYGIAIIVRRYWSGQDISVVVEITSNHMGYFVFKLCRIHPYERECVGQDLLDRNVVPIVYPDGTLRRKYLIETTEKRFTAELTLRLPAGFNCTRCTFQWTYVTGNSWGTCDDGTQAMGCGKQETFVNCADVSVMPMPYNYNTNNNANSNPRTYHLPPQLTSSSRCNPYRQYYRDTSRAGAPMTALAIRFQRCCSVNNTEHTPGMDSACQARCMKYPPDCPQDTCRCVKDVVAREEFRKSRPMADQWCLDQCNVYPARDCDESKCEVIYTSAHPST